MLLRQTYINSDKLLTFTVYIILSCREPFSCDHQFNSKMMSSKSVTLFIIVLFIAVFVFNVGAAYRKPPFNGSIFGKRGNTLEYDGAGKTLSAMCEIASEACQAWFPNQEKK